MVSIARLFDARRKGLMQRLDAGSDPQAAADAVRACLSGLQQDYIAAEDDAGLRTVCADLFAAARSAAQLLTAASGVEVSLRLNAPPLLPAAKAARRAASFIPLALSAAAAVLLIARGNTVASIVGLAAAAGSAWQAFFAARPAAQSATLPEATGEVRVDAQALATQVEAVCVAMDRILAAHAERNAGSGDAPRWTEAAYAAVQTLWEAIHAGDGVYALKTAPALLDALAAEDVQLLTYTPETAALFETVPGQTGGQTIRPALVSGGRLLARGQVTIPMRGTGGG